LEAIEHPDFSFEEAKRVLDDISSYASPVVVLSGGEPLLRKDVFDIAKYGGEKGLRMCLATNGTLITEELCGKIKEADIKMVSLSLDGSTAEIHDNFRNSPGAFDATVNAAKLVHRVGAAAVNVTNVITPSSTAPTIIPISDLIRASIIAV